MYKSEASLADIFANPSPKVSQLVESYLVGVKWESLSMEEIRDVTKFLENNRNFVEYHDTNLERAWEAFVKRPERLEDGFVLETLYWFSCCFKERVLKYFQEQILPSLLAEDNTERLSNPILNMTSSLRNLDYLVPLLVNLNSEALLKDPKILSIINL